MRANTFRKFRAWSGCLWSLPPPRYIFFLLISIYEAISLYSPGLRPIGVSGAFLDGLTAKGSYFQLVLETPPAQKLHVIKWPKSLWRPFADTRIICDGFGDRKFRAHLSDDFCIVVQSIFDKYWNHFGSILLRFSPHFSSFDLHRFCF